MRAVEKGNAPSVYTHYGQARKDLTDAIGWYCSYCEMGIRHMIEVEHVIPIENGGDPLDWDNFLLACKYCNRTKWYRNLNRGGYLWPDRDNTDLAFEYNEATAIVPRTGTGVDIEATATIDLMGLDRYPGGPIPPTLADSRHIHRLDAWRVIKLSLANWQELPEPAMARQIGIAAGKTGFYSAWMTVFAGIDDVLDQIVASFTGTYTASDATGVRLIRSNPPDWTGQI